MSFDSSQPPQHPGPPPIVSQTPPAAPEERRHHVLGTVAFVVAVLGTVFAVIPGALIVGWVLLPIAFILAIVGFFTKGKKLFAILALVLSIVGTIAGVIAFVVGVANAVDDAFGESETTVTEQKNSGHDDEPAENEPAADAPGEPGTRDNPLPLGSEVSSDVWSITVNSVQFGATAAVLAENQFNEAPGDGEEYVLVNVTAAYKGDDSGVPEVGTSIEYVTAGGVTIDAWAAAAITPDAFDSLTELYTDGSVTGNLAFVVPSDAVKKGTIVVRPGVLADKRFFAVR